MSKKMNTQTRSVLESNLQKSGPPKPYLLFDAGGTLVFPNETFILKQALVFDIQLTHTQLYEGYYRVIHKWDTEAHHYGYSSKSPWPRVYFEVLFEILNLVDHTAPKTIEKLIQACVSRHDQKNLWTFTFPWIRDTLSLLKSEGYRMSVISNSDGRTKNVFCDLGLAHYFDEIFDSVELYAEKPEPLIFEKVLDRLEIEPSEALYIGDIFEVDVLGANQARIGALHLDPLNLYDISWGGTHLKDIRELPLWLASFSQSTSRLDLFPFLKPDEKEVYLNFSAVHQSKWIPLTA